MKKSYSNYIPEDIQNQLMSYNAMTTEICFSIGDIANLIYTNLKAMSKQNKEDANQDIVFAAIGYFCGKSSRTVRHYYSVARAFPREIREKYSVLSFSHFSFARSCPDKIAVLEYAVEGGVKSVDNVIEHFLYNKEQSYDNIQSTCNTVVQMLDEAAIRLCSSLSHLEGALHAKTSEALNLIEEVKLELEKYNNM